MSNKSSTFIFCYAYNLMPMLDKSNVCTTQNKRAAAFHCKWMYFWCTKMQWSSWSAPDIKPLSQVPSGNWALGNANSTHLNVSIQMRSYKASTQNEMGGIFETERCLISGQLVNKETTRCLNCLFFPERGVSEARHGELTFTRTLICLWHSSLLTLCLSFITILQRHLNMHKYTHTFKTMGMDRSISSELLWIDGERTGGQIMLTMCFPYVKEWMCILPPFLPPSLFLSSNTHLKPPISKV